MILSNLLIWQIRKEQRELWLVQGHTASWRHSNDKKLGFVLWLPLLQKAKKTHNTIKSDNNLIVTVIKPHKNKIFPHIENKGLEQGVPQIKQKEAAFVHTVRKFLKGPTLHLFSKPLPPSRMCILCFHQHFLVAKVWKVVTSGIENWWMVQKNKCGTNNKEERTEGEGVEILLGTRNPENGVRIKKSKRVTLDRH